MQNIPQIWKRYFDWTCAKWRRDQIKIISNIEVNVLHWRSMLKYVLMSHWIAMYAMTVVTLTFRKAEWCCYEYSTFEFIAGAILLEKKNIIWKVTAIFDRFLFMKSDSIALNVFSSTLLHFMNIAKHQFLKETKKTNMYDLELVLSLFFYWRSSINGSVCNLQIHTKLQDISWTKKTNRFISSAKCIYYVFDLTWIEYEIKMRLRSFWSRTEFYLLFTFYRWFVKYNKEFDNCFCVENFV